MQQVRIFLTICTAIFLLSGCEYQKLLKKGSNEDKLEGAMAYYNKGDYNRAQPLLEDLIGAFRERQKAEQVYFYYAFTFYNMNDHLLAGHHFKRFSETYRSSKYREEATFMFAKCSYHNTLPYKLDQTSTKKAIEQIQLFVNQYSESEFIPECNELIDELRAKLHRKAYEGAMMYYNMADYRSAVISFKNAVLDFPDIPELAEINYLIVESSLKYAEKSIRKVQEERYSNTVAECKDYYAGNSKGTDYYLKVQRIEEIALKRLEELKTKVPTEEEKTLETSMK